MLTNYYLELEVEVDKEIPWNHLFIIWWLSANLECSLAIYLGNSHIHFSALPDIMSISCSSQIAKKNIHDFFMILNLNMLSLYLSF